MPVTTVHAWLERRRRNECILSLVSSALACGGGIIALALAFCFIYLAVNIAVVVVLHGRPPPPRVCLALSSALMGLLFIESTRGRREDLPAHFAAGLWVFRECFCAGPWLLFSAGKNVARALRLTRIDLASCAQVLSFLAARNTSASKEELLRALPHLAWAQVVAELLLLEGVLFFRPDLSRVSLTEPLRLELRPLLPPDAQAQASPRPQRPEPVPVTDPRKLSCHELLGISPAASLSDIKIAYRKRMKECHPDRFANVGKEYQQLAEEWTKAINAAYETLLDQRSGPGS